MQHQETLPVGPLASLGQFEPYGVGRIPEAERTGTPWRFARLFLGASFAPGSILWGWLPITLGLGVRDAVTSIVVGTLVGLLPIAPLVLIGTHTATNNATSSGAFFGVRGRLIGSGLGLALMLVTAALAIWTAGGILVAVAARLVGTPSGNGALAAAYLVLTALSVAIAVWGYQLLLRVTTVLAVAGIGFGLLLVVAFWNDLNLGYGGGQYALESFWTTWLLSAAAYGVGGVMLVASGVGDWSRYIPARRYPARRLLPVALGAIAFGFIIPPAIGAVVTSAFADPHAPWPQSAVMAAPGWCLVLLFLMASLGSLGFLAPTIYSTGLDLDAIVARLSRARATAIMGVVSLGLVLAGPLVWDAKETLTAATLLLLALTAPWAAVIGVGHLRCRGRYLPDDLQIWNHRQTGGRYCYFNGWNLRAVLAWATGAAFGLATVTTPVFTAPLAGIANGIDVSFLGSSAIAAILALMLDRPQPAPCQDTGAAAVPATEGRR